MSYFGKKGVVAQTHEIEITDGYKVLVGRLTKAQSDQCETILSGGDKATSRVVSRGDGVNQNVEQETILTMEYRRYREAVLLAGIRDWNLDEDGVKAPIDAEHINGMLEADANMLFVAIKDFNKPPTKTELGK